METKKKIFIIDDDNFLLDMYALKFSKFNFEVTTALGPEIAIEKLKGGFKPDIILLDIIMPVMDGFELLKKMNDEKMADGAVKIILSNRGQASDIARGTTLGAAGYIVKALSTPAEVIDKVNEILKSSKK